MNILQFWLIDSIVKAGAHQASVALPSDSARNSDEEPLFRSSMDDDDDDDEPHRHDIENPAPAPRSRSRSKDDRDVSLVDDSKSSEATLATASGSVTPKRVDGNQATTITHAYPPSMASTSSSPASSRHSSISPPKRRRSPPPRLALQPRSPMPAASNPALPSADPAAPPTLTERQADALYDEKEWATWEDDNNDNWAERVGEEDWTGRRIDAKKATLHDAWTERGQGSVWISSR